MIQRMRGDGSETKTWDSAETTRGTITIAVEGRPSGTEHQKQETHLHTLADNARRDQAVAGNLLHNLVVGGLIQHNCVDQLLTDLTGRPLLRSFERIIMETENIVEQCVGMRKRVETIPV